MWKVGQGCPVRIATRSTARASNKNPVDQTASGSSAPTAVLGAGPDISQAQAQAHGHVQSVRPGQARSGSRASEDKTGLI